MCIYIYTYIFVYCLKQVQNVIHAYQQTAQCSGGDGFCRPKAGPSKEYVQGIKRYRCTDDVSPWFTLVNSYSYWKWPFSSLIYPLKMVIFHGSASLPEGIVRLRMVPSAYRFPIVLSIEGCCTMIKNWKSGNHPTIFVVYDPKTWIVQPPNMASQWPNL